MIVIDEQLKEYLKTLADKYENENFYNGDPSCILLRYQKTDDIECASFISAMLAFGRRDQFLKKIDFIMEKADKHGGPAQWLLQKKYLMDFIPENVKADDKFYRFYSWTDLIALFECLSNILEKGLGFGGYIRMCHEKMNQHLSQSLCSCFAGCKIVPQGKNSANKRVHMFLRWMVRQNSSVDLGLWDWYNPSDLIIPLDTHVMQESVKLGLLPEKSNGSAKTALQLTEALRQIWPDDPCRGDYALFGVGVSQSVH